MGTSHSTRKITLVNDDKAGVIKLSESLAYRLRGQIEGQQATGPTETPPPSSTGPPHIAAIPQGLEQPKTPQIIREPFISEPALALPPDSLGAEASKTSDTAPENLTSGTHPSMSAGITRGVELTDEATGEIQPDVGVDVRAGPGPNLSQPGGSIPPWSIYAEEAHLMVMRLREEKEQELQQISREWKEKMDSREHEFSKMSQLSEEEVDAAIKEVEKLFVKVSCTPVCQDHQEAVMGCYQDHPHQALRCSRQVEDFTQCVDLSRLQSVLRQRAN